MCGALPCQPMHPGCTHSPEWKAECLERHNLASSLLAQRAVDWDGAVKRFQDYEQEHGKAQADLLRAEIKRQK